MTRYKFGVKGDILKTLVLDYVISDHDRLVLTFVANLE